MWVYIYIYVWAYIFPHSQGERELPGEQFMGECNRKLPKGKNLPWRRAMCSNDTTRATVQAWSVKHS